MTLREQIMKLQTYKMYEGEDTVYVERDDVLKALEQEPCEDAISRQAVLDKLNRLIEVERLQGTDEMGYGRERVSAYECMIDAVESEYLYPTIQPQPKTGHWIMKHRSYGEMKYLTGTDEMGIEHTVKKYGSYEFDEPYCSECGKLAGDISLNYCSNCGAYMRGDKE